MHSTHTAELPIQALPPAARHVDVFPSMDKSLIGVGPLCDAGCKVVFDTTKCTITCPNEETIHCPRHEDGLWTLPIHTVEQACTAIKAHCNQPDSTLDTASNLTQDDNESPPLAIDADTQLAMVKTALAVTHHTNSSTPGQMVAFAHAALFSPPLSTLEMAMKKG